VSLNTVRLTVLLREYRRKWYIVKNRCFGLHFCRRKFRYIFNHFYAMRPESYRIRWNNAW